MFVVVEWKGVRAWAVGQYGGGLVFGMRFGDLRVLMSSIKPGVLVKVPMASVWEVT